MNHSVAFQEHDEGNTLKFEIFTRIEDESRQKLCGHMMLQECSRIEYIVQKIPNQEVEDMLLSFEREEETQGNNGAVNAVTEDAD